MTTKRQQSVMDTRDASQFWQGGRACGYALGFRMGFLAGAVIGVAVFAALAALVDWLFPGFLQAKP